MPRAIAFGAFAVAALAGCGGGGDDESEVAAPVTISAVDWHVGEPRADRLTLSAGADADLWLNLTYSDASTTDLKAQGLCVDFFHCNGPAQPIFYQVTLDAPSGVGALLRSTGASGTGRFYLDSLQVSVPVEVSISFVTPGFPTVTKRITINP